MHPSRVLPALRHARFWREFLSALLFVSLLLPAHAAAPQWWAQRGVIAPDKARDDFAAINQGQLKNLAAKAVAEMNAKLTGGAGTALNQQVASWSTNTAQADDFAGVNIGQAKAVARPVYERLLAAGAITALPSWITAPAASNQDFAAANIGQVKNLFAFEVPDQVGTSGTDATHPETGPGLPANSPFVISYHGWRSGSLRPDLESTATVDTTGKVGFIRRYRWALTWGAETKPEKKLVSTHNQFLSAETDQESWKNDNTTAAESYRKLVTVMEPIYSDPENSSSILTQVKEHLRTYNISVYGETHTDQFVASHFSTAEKNIALQRNGQTTYEVLDATWTEAECHPLTVGQAPPSHFFQQEAYGPTPPASSSWSAAAPSMVSNPETVLQSPGAEIPYESLILPNSGALVATADSILEKEVSYYRNSEGNLLPAERYVGRKSTGRIKIAWRTDLSPALTTEQKQAWLSHFKVVTKNNYQYSGQPLSTHSSTVPLTQYLGVNSTQAIEIAHLYPHMQPGYQAHIELSLVPNSFVPPGTINPETVEPGNPPPINPEGFTLRWEYPEKGILYTEDAYTNYRDANDQPLMVRDDQNNLIPYPDSTVYNQQAHWSTSFNIKYFEALYDSEGKPKPGTKGEGSSNPLIRLNLIPFPAYETRFDNASQAIQVGFSQRTVTRRNNHKISEDVYCDYVEKRQGETRTRVRLKASTTLPAGYSLTVIPVVEETTLVQESSGDSWVPLPLPARPKVTVKPTHVFNIPPGRIFSADKEFDVPLASEATSVVVRLLPVELVSRDKFLAGSFEIPVGWDNLAIEFISPNGGSLGKYGNLLGNGSTKIYDRVTDILSETDTVEGGQPPDQKVWFVREGTGSRKISFYTCFNSVGQAQINIYPHGSGTPSGTIVHDLVVAQDFADTIAYVDAWVKGTSFDWSVPPVVLPPSVLALASQIAADPSANGISPMSIANMLASGAIITADTNIPLVPDVANLTLGQPLADASALGNLAALQVAPLDTVQPQTSLTLTPGTVYWLSNSVLHPLSEEQLNAITTHAGSLTMTARPSLATQPPAGGFVAGTADPNLNGPIDNLTRAALIPFFNVINQVEGLGNVAVGLFDGVKGGLKDDWAFILLIGKASVQARDWAYLQAKTEILTWQTDPRKRAAELKSLAEKICMDMVFKPLQLGQELTTWNGFRRRAWQIWQAHKSGAQTIWTVTKSAWPNIVNGLTDWADDFNRRMMAGSEKAHWDGAPWMKDHLLSEINSTTRQMCYTFGYTFGYLCEQVAIGALSSGTVKMAQVAAKGGAHLAGSLAKRTAAAVAARAHMLKRLLSETAKLPDDLLAAYQREFSLASVGPTGEGMNRVAMEMMQEGANAGKLVWRDYVDDIVGKTNIRQLVKQGGEGIIERRFAQLMHILGDDFTAQIGRNFLKVADEIILVPTANGNVDEFFEAFFRAFDGNPSLMVSADVGASFSKSSLSANGKATLKKFLSDPNAGKLWEIDVPAIVDNEPAVPHNYWVRGILAELSIYKRIYKKAGYSHAPTAPGYDFTGPKWVQVKSLKNPDGAVGAMRKAVDSLIANSPNSPSLRLHILKKPGTSSGTLEANLREYARTHPTGPGRVEIIVEEFDLIP